MPMAFYYIWLGRSTQMFSRMPPIADVSEPYRFVRVVP
jgi:hypothetical protein